MESIEKEYERLRKKSNLSKSISDVDKCIQLLQNARQAIANGRAFDFLSATLIFLNNRQKNNNKLHTDSPRPILCKSEHCEAPANCPRSS
jgi:hypothetical protein